MAAKNKVKARKKLTRHSLAGLLLLFMVACPGGDNGGGTGIDDDGDNGGGEADTKTTIVTTSDDVFVYAVDPDENYNDGAPSCPNCGIALKLIPKGGFEGEARILLKYWVNDIPSGSQILSATMRLKDLQWCGEQQYRLRFLLSPPGNFRVVPLDRDVEQPANI